MSRMISWSVRDLISTNLVFESSQLVPLETLVVLLPLSSWLRPFVAIPLGEEPFCWTWESLLLLVSLLESFNWLLSSLEPLAIDCMLAVIVFECECDELWLEWDNDSTAECVDWLTADDALLMSVAVKVDVLPVTVVWLCLCLFLGGGVVPPESESDSVLEASVRYNYTKCVIVLNLNTTQIIWINHIITNTINSMLNNQQIY